MIAMAVSVGDDIDLRRDVPADRCAGEGGIGEDCRAALDLAVAERMARRRDFEEWTNGELHGREVVRQPVFEGKRGVAKSIGPASDLGVGRQVKLQVETVGQAVLQRRSAKLEGVDSVVARPVDEAGFDLDHAGRDGAGRRRLAGPVGADRVLARGESRRGQRRCGSNRQHEFLKHPCPLGCPTAQGPRVFDRC